MSSDWADATFKELVETAWTTALKWQDTYMDQTTPMGIKDQQRAELTAKRSAIIAELERRSTALRDAARVPEGCVRIGDKDYKCEVALPLCGDRLVIPNVCTVFATVEGEVREGDIDATWDGVGATYHGLFYKLLDGGVLETTKVPLDECRATAEAALAQPTPAHGENLCRSCGRHRDTHVGTQRSCFGGTGEIFTPAREEGENVTCEHDIIRTACPTCNIWASTHRPKEPAND